MIQLPIALQAYSLRRIYEENPLRALKLIREAGYDGVELYGTHFQTELYPALLREAGLVCAGWHTGIDALEQDFDNTLRRNLAVGNHSIAVPWFNADSAAGWKAFAERLNAAAEKLSRYGIRLGYHNHAHEFQPVDGETPWSIVAENTEGPVFLQREDAAADGLRAFGLVGGVERALGLADVGAQSFLFFDDGHGISLRSDKISSPLW